MAMGSQKVAAGAPSRSHRSANGYSALRTTVVGLSRALFLSLPSVAATPIRILSPHYDDDEPEAEGGNLIVLYVASIILVLLGGVFAGLTIALMGQDTIYLRVLSGDEDDPNSKNAKRVYNLLKRGKHWVLVSLLLGNVIVNESLPVVLDRCLGGGLAAIVGSTVLIVIFGEVVPQSVCVRYGLPIGGLMAKPVLVLMWLLAPVAWPTAKLLDWALGEDHGTVYKKSGLKQLVGLHQQLGEVSERLNEDEVTIISAVLDLKAKAVEDVMTPMDDVFIMSEETVLDEKTMDVILSQGYSRIPIHSPGNKENFVGMLLVKILITYDPEDCMKVRDFPLATLPETRPETSCLDLVNFFQEGKSHMVLVSEYPGEDHGALGVVTLEDVIEELIGEEIIDESDVYIDVHKAIRRLTPAPKARPLRRNTGDTGALKAPDPQPDLIDLVESHESQNQRGGSVSAQSDLGGLSSSPRMTTFMMRRSSAGPESRAAAAVPVKAGLEEMRSHLKHLGPSNPATNPKNTKSTTVKIKGLGSTAAPAAGLLNAVLPPRAASAVPELGDQDDEHTPLNRPKLTGKGGVQAVRRSYGGVGMSDAQERLAAVAPEVLIDLAPPDKKAGGENGNKPDKSDTTDFGTQTVPSYRSEMGLATSPHGSHDSLSSLPSNGGGQTPRRRHLVRSGSITENIIEAGGVQKIVLQTHSSEEEESGSQGKKKLYSDGDDLDDEDELLSPHSTEPAGSSSHGADGAGGGETAPTASGGAKKKNRRKKRKGPRT